VFKTLTSQIKSTIVYYNFYHSYYAFESRPTFESSVPSIGRSPENKTFYNSEINLVTITPNSQTRTQIHFGKHLREVATIRLLSTQSIITIFLDPHFQKKS